MRSIEQLATEGQANSGRTTVDVALDPAQKATLVELSRRTRVSQAEIVRMAVAAFLANHPPIGLDIVRNP